MKNQLLQVVECVNKGDLDFTEALLNLTQYELKDKKERSKVAIMKVANFPYQKTLQEFDFNFQPSINKNEIMDLKYLKFIDNHYNIVFVGPP